MVFRLVGLALLISLASPLYAQEAFSNALHQSGDNSATTAANLESAWIDLRQHAPGDASPQTAPNWVEAINLSSTRTTSDGSLKSIFRIRLSQPSPDYRVLFFRLFFDDQAGAQPELIAWDESGSQVLRSGPLGSGIGLASSDSVMIPMIGVSTLDIEVAGDGKTVRGAYLDWMASSEIAHPLSADRRDVIPEPFSSVPPLHAPERDVEQFGTVVATLAAEPIRIGPSAQDAAVFQFGIESQPLIGLLTFEIASPRIDSPPEIYLNGKDIGPVSIALPELADPGYRGEMEPLMKDMQFHYTGWLRAQILIPAASLKPGNNDLIITNGPAGSTSAIRATQIQLKYLWEKSDYLLRPGK